MIDIGKRSGIGAQHSLFNRKLSYKMLIWSMRRRRDKAEVVLDVSEEFPSISNSPA